MQIIIEIPDDKIPIKQCYKDVLIKFVDRQVCEVTLIGQIPRKDETGLWFDVLPEGHVDLIDKDHIITRIENERDYFNGMITDIFDRRYAQGLNEAAIKVSEEKAIIPADKEGNEDEKH